MNRIQTILLLVCFFAMTVQSCAPYKLTPLRWSKSSGTDSVLIPPNLKAESKSLNVGDLQLEFQTQKISGVEIEGSFYKRIFDVNESKFITQRWLERIPLSLQTEISLMKNERYFVAGFIKSHSEFSAKKLIETPKLIIRADDLQLNWKVILEEKDGHLTAVYLDKFLNVVTVKKLGSEFVDATALLYPMGPLQSKVAQVILKRVSDEGMLNSKWFKITPKSGILARAEKNQFLYPQSDGRFEQVQVYFYLNQTADWFLENFKFQLPFLLEVETSVGFPEKTNTAFYYNYKIRLGEGDGIVFLGMALDPSIVIHESIHAVIQATASLPYDGQGGSLNEAFADFFTASILDNPKLGEASYKKAGYKRTIDNNLKRTDINDGLYHDSGIVAGLLWQFRQTIGPVASQRLAWNTLLRLTPASNFDSFEEELVDVLKNEEASVRLKVLAILESRGWQE